MLAGVLVLHDFRITWVLTDTGVEYDVSAEEHGTEKVIIQQEKFNLFALAMYAATLHNCELPEGCTVPYDALYSVMPKNHELRWIS